MSDAPLPASDPLGRPVAGERVLPAWSLVGLDIGAMRSERPAGADASVIGLVRRAFAIGVTVFDLSGGLDPDGNRVLASRALGSDLPTVVTLLAAPTRARDFRARPTGGPYGAPPIPLPANTPRSKVELSNSITLVPASLLAQAPPEESGSALGAASEIPSGVGPRWGVDLPSPAVESASWGMALRRGASLVRLKANLLDLASLNTVRSSASFGALPLVLHGPHARGLLDGGWLEAGGLARIQPQGPVEWRGLRDRLTPITQLGFLTGDRRRTLAVAAVQALLEGLPRASVVVAPRDLPTLEKLADPAQWVPFSVEEKRALESWRVR